MRRQHYHPTGALPGPHSSSLRPQSKQNIIHILIQKNARVIPRITIRVGTGIAFHFNLLVKIFSALEALPVIYFAWKSP
jgi:hypothetical protein